MVLMINPPNAPCVNLKLLTYFKQYVFETSASRMIIWFKCASNIDPTLKLE